MYSTVFICTVLCSLYMYCDVYVQGVHTLMYIYTYIVNARACTHIYSSAHTFVSICTYVCMYTHKYTYTFMFTHSYVQYVCIYSTYTYVCTVCTYTFTTMSSLSSQTCPATLSSVCTLSTSHTSDASHPTALHWSLTAPV